MGGNQGEVEQTLDRAVARINLQCGRVIRSSSIYSTQAWGPVPQPDFLNRVIEIETLLSPGLLLKSLLETETHFGRRRTVKYGPRTLDLDILFYGTRVIRSPQLVLPHPELQNRRFVLVPLVESWPNLRHPVLGMTMRELLEICPDTLEVKTWKK